MNLGPNTHRGPNVTLPPLPFQIFSISACYLDRDLSNQSPNIWLTILTFKNGQKRLETKPMLVTLMNFFLQSVTISLATFCYPSCYSKKLIVSSPFNSLFNRHSPKKKRSTGAAVVVVLVVVVDFKRAKLIGQNTSTWNHRPIGFVLL